MSFHQLIDIKFADPVGSLAITDKYVVSGTMMGRLSICSLFDKKVLHITEFSTENITGIIFESEDSFHVSIGDDEIVKYKLSYYENQLSQENFKTKNYEDEAAHKARCDGCYSMLGPHHILLINLPATENGNEVVTQDTQFTRKQFYNNYDEDLVISMTNYSVPFDFDGNRFLWVEFESEKSRNICVYFFDKKSEIRHKLNKEFGHISHCKLLPNNKLLLVRLQNIVEIRDISDFKTLRSFTNIGEEVIAMDIFINSTKILLHEPQADNNINEQGYQKVEKKEEVVVQIKDDFKDENLSVVLLDIDGNVNVWENMNITTKVNLYNLDDINVEYKNKQFFSMGYPYYIKMNQNYFAISTDHGVFIIKKPE